MAWRVSVVTCIGMRMSQIHGVGGGWSRHVHDGAALLRVERREVAGLGRRLFVRAENFILSDRCCKETCAPLEIQKQQRLLSLVEFALL